MTSLVNNMAGLSERLRATLPVSFGLPEFSHTASVVSEGDIPAGELLPATTTTVIPVGFAFEQMSNTLAEKIIPVEEIDEVTVKRRFYKVSGIALSIGEMSLLDGVWTIDGKPGYQVIKITRKTVNYEVVLSAPYE